MGIDSTKEDRRGGKGSRLSCLEALVDWLCIWKKKVYIIILCKLDRLTLM